MFEMLTFLSSPLPATCLAAYARMERTRKEPYIRSSMVDQVSGAVGLSTFYVFTVSASIL